jgi:hypothetical protein
MWRCSLRRIGIALASGSLLVACGLTTIATGPAADGAPSDTADGALGADGAGSPDGALQLDLDGAVEAAEGSSHADATVDPYSTRVTTGLYALYEFEENAGAKAHDGIAPAYDLTVADPPKVTWHPHHLELTDYTSLSNAATFDKLVTQGQATHEVTIEAWVKITAIAGGSDVYGRLVSIIQDASNRDIDMGLHGTSLWASLESSNTQIEKGSLAVALTHLVLTRAANQTLSMYVNGALFASASGVGDPASFSAYRLFVANSFNGDRGILGELHLVAFYRQALTPAQIATNFAAGADPK